MNMQQLQIIINDLDLHTSLDLSGKNLDDKGVAILAEALKRNITITSLNLSNNNIGNEGAQALSAMLEENITLKHLDLSKNNIKYEGVNSSSLSGALKKNCILESLNLNDNKLDQNNPDGRSIKSLCRAITENKTLTFIGLSNNGINEKSAKALESALDFNESLTAIDLSNNNLRGKSAQHIIYGIFQHANSFKAIDLSNNGFDGKNAWDIADIFEKNETLTYLNLSNNALESSDRAALAIIDDVIQKNITINLNTQIETPSLMQSTENFETISENNKKRKFFDNNENITLEGSNKKLKLATHVERQKRNEVRKIHGVGSNAMMFNSKNSLNQKSPDEKKEIINRRLSI